MPARLRRSNLKLAAAFFFCLAVLITPGLFAQDDPTSYLTPDVTRVGDRLACRCGGCRNTVGNCPMLHCGFSDPMRQRIHAMKQQGLSDDSIVSSIVREQGVVALSSPPAGSIGGLVTWLMPGIMLLAGFFVYLSFVRRHKKAPAPLSTLDRALLDRFHAQIDRELDEAPQPRPNEYR